MLPTRRALGVCVMAVVTLLVAGCSSGGAKRSTPSTVRATTRTTLGGPTGSGSGTGPLNVAADLGPCSKTYPKTPLTELNARVAGLDRKLVPIRASTVRICKWGARDIYSNGGEAAQTVPDKLVAFATLTARRASEFEDVTNRQPNGRAGPLGCTGPNGGIGYEFLRLTFANNASQVDVEEDDGPCTGPQLSNGKLLAVPSFGWLTDLRVRITASTGTVVGTVREVGGPTEMRREIPGTVIATNGSGQHWRTTTTATRPFSITLPAGMYRFTGTSPLINSGESKCFASAPVVVVGGKTTEVEVVCSIR